MHLHKVSRKRDICSFEGGIEIFEYPGVEPVKLIVMRDVSMLCILVEKERESQTCISVAEATK